MTIGPDGGQGGPMGFSYCGIFTPGPRETLLTVLGELRFSGWVGPQEGLWVVAVPARLRGAVAGEKRTAADVARELSAAVGAVSFAATVVSDKLLEVHAYSAGEPVLTYYSDPTVAFPYNDEVMPDPMGVDDAPALAAALGADDVADDLTEQLAEELGESENESERITRVLRLLGAPSWIVAADALPKDVPSGPRAKEFTRLGAGRPGVPGLLDDAVRGIVRKKK